MPVIRVRREIIHTDTENIYFPLGSQPFICYYIPNTQHTTPVTDTGSVVDIFSLSTAYILRCLTDKLGSRPRKGTQLNLSSLSGFLDTFPGDTVIHRRRSEFHSFPQCRLSICPCRVTLLSRSPLVPTDFRGRRSGRPSRAPSTGAVPRPLREPGFSLLLSRDQRKGIRNERRLSLGRCHEDDTRKDATHAGLVHRDQGPGPLE
ncbi:hypothetical protein F5Y08DRAFT_308314 [Xylaria arbuscula]|nr:hypothetical protein F5Y08DRAFT_308314 [Xylaria arbuscula]